VLVFATPIYYYEMSGALKTMLDRANPLYPSDYKFRKVYVIATAAENEEYVPQKAFSGIEGWVDCFEKAELAGTLFCGGVNDAGEINGNSILQQAFAMGKGI
jgi:multimeric flavodoxin WrbA